MNLTRWLASRTECLEPISSHLMEDGFGHDAASRIVGTNEEHVERTRHGGSFLMALRLMDTV